MKLTKATPMFVETTARLGDELFVRSAADLEADAKHNRLLLAVIAVIGVAQ